MGGGRAGAASLDDAQLAQRVAGFSRWHYEFELRGVRTPISDPRLINRHRQRVGYFFEPLIQRHGGSLRGLRVLDLGCNAGFWSLRALRAGCEFVLGVDARAMHIDQAELVMAVEELPCERFEFVQSNLFELALERWPPFDVVLCLGLMYHVARPVELMRLMADSGPQTILIDTSLSRLSGSSFEVRHDDLDDPRNAVDREFVMWPTRQAVLDLAHHVGYCAETLEPAMDDWTGCEDYHSGDRRAFVCTPQLPAQPGG